MLSIVFACRGALSLKLKGGFGAMADKIGEAEIKEMCSDGKSYERVMWELELAQAREKLLNIKGKQLPDPPGPSFTSD